MDNYIVSARKYRPSGFDSVVGQESITRTLKNAIINNQLAHAYLFCGPHGVGKTTCARIFAKTINCMNLNEKAEACNTCESCEAFNQGRSFSIHELDAASNNSVEDIRSLNEQVRIPPQVGKYSLYIIDEVHMLSAGAFNAFLKTLEEPPAHAVFILATTEKHKIIPTILSRCQIYDFNRIRIEKIVKYLEFVSKQENVNAEIEALSIIAQKADGSMRDALSLFDQIVSFSEGQITYNQVIENLNVLDYDYYFRLTQAFLDGDYSSALLILREILDKGFDGLNLISGLSNHFRDLLVCKDKSTIELLEVSAGIKKRYLEQSSACNPVFLFKALEINNSCSLSYKISKNKKLHMELNLIKISRILEPASSSSVSDEKNEAQKKKIINTEIKSVKDQDTKPDQKTEVKTEPVADNIVEEKVEKLKKKEYKGNINKTISIKDAIKGNQVSKESISDFTDNNPLLSDDKVKDLKNEFSQEKLVEKWKMFSEGLKNNEPRLYNTLSAHLPVLKDNYHIEVILNNPLQDKAIKGKWHELLIFLKKNLENGSITLETKIARTENNKLYTDEEKFDYLNEKNPNIGELRHKLNLDFE
ncbi:DNA polymerase III subunit gamma/tau [Bacteroidota bacterium]